MDCIISLLMVSCKCPQSLTLAGSEHRSKLSYNLTYFTKVHKVEGVRIKGKFSWDLARDHYSRTAVSQVNRRQAPDYSAA